MFMIFILIEIEIDIEISNDELLEIYGNTRKREKKKLIVIGGVQQHKAQIC
jgi:hypothetical protein